MISGYDEFQYLVLNNKADWEKGLPVRLQISDEGIKIAETVEYVTERVIGTEDLPAGFAVQDFAVGCCRRIYILDTLGSIWIYDPGKKLPERIECIHALFSNPVSIALSSNTLYVADRLAQRIFALARLNWHVRWVAEAIENFSPLDLTVDKKGYLYALDEQSPAVIKFDQAGKYAGKYDLGGRDGDLAAVSCFGSRFLYVLDVKNKKVLRVNLQNKVIDDSFIEFEQTSNPSCLSVDTKGNLYAGYRQASRQEEQKLFIHKFEATGKLIGEIPAYQGPVEKLAVDEGDRIYIFNKEKGFGKEEQKIVILKPEWRFIRPQKKSLASGIYFSKAFDSTKAGMQWHKIMLEADIPDNVQVKVSYLTAETKEWLINGKNEDLDNYLADAASISEAQLKDKIKDLDTLNWSEPFVNPRDALIGGPAGRYLWLRIELTGSELRTPTVKGIRVYLPRMSYLRYLPAVYQEDQASRDFLERFLSLFETFLTNFEEQIDHIVRYFDAGFVSGDLLRWLASWLAVAVDENWTDEKLRELIKQAPELYKKRGTREGIEEIIKLYTGSKPFIIEQFQLKGAQDRELINRLYGADPYDFCLLLKPFQVQQENELSAVRRIVAAEKPAHTQANIVALQPWIYLDLHTYLGVNTYLTKPAPLLDAGAFMPRDTVLADIDEAGQIERRSRVSLDITLT